MTSSPPATIVSAVASVCAVAISIMALLRTGGFNRSTRTNQLLDIHKSHEFQFANKWVMLKMIGFINKHRINTYSGLGALDNGGHIEFKEKDGKTTQRDPSVLARDVLNFYESVSRDLIYNRVDRYIIMAAMANNMVLAHASLKPAVTRIKSRAYGASRITHFDRVVDVIKRRSTSKGRAVEISDKWDSLYYFRTRVKRWWFAIMEWIADLALALQKRRPRR